MACHIPTFLIYPPLPLLVPDITLSQQTLKVNRNTEKVKTMVLYDNSYHLWEMVGCSVF